ncbi:TIMELESS-interacting protein-like isoform X2 [Oscarella lobularis]|uniref:TIMELESS-interacting protein-like isoform X2 n=1 Tax=Oscarella lobularis TaxID=121494 RepID=UPI0033143E1D
MDDFDDDGLFADDEIPERPPMLPPLSPGQNLPDVESGLPLAAPRDGDGEGNDPGTDMPKPKIRKNVIKLDSERIINRKRGLPRLVKDFSKVKFRGKGYEANDIQKLIKEYELWANRLFPKYQFDQVLLKLEGPQGSKKEVKECLRKLRRGEDMEDDEIHSENEGNGASIERNAENDVNMEDFGGGVRTANLEEEEEENPVPTPTPTPVSILSDEVRERMKQRREEALARKAQREVERQNFENHEEEEEEDDPLSPPNLVIADV